MREYIADIPKLGKEVYELQNQFNGTNGNGIRTKLNKLIKEDPHLIEAYNLRHDILEKEGHLVAQGKEIIRAYKAVLELILDEEGNFPDKLEWGYTENRPILTAIGNYAIEKWSYLKWDEAAFVMEKVLSMNPNDNQGMRFFYLALKERMTFNQFMDRFIPKKPTEMFAWFNKEALKYKCLKDYPEE